MNAEENANSHEMTEAELAKELKGAVAILGTTSPDKRDKYRALFSTLGMDGNHTGGTDFFFTDSGALRIVPVKLPERTNDYGGNLSEKSINQLETLEKYEKLIRNKLKVKSGSQGFDPKTVNIIGITEDSGWQLEFANSQKEEKFLNAVKEKMDPQLRDKEKDLLDNLNNTGFPGPNLKPFQQHLPGGFHQLMEIIYDSAKDAGVKELRYSTTSTMSFASPRLDKGFTKSVTAEGRMLTRSEYDERLLQVEDGEAINSDFVHIPDGQPKGKKQTMEELGRKLLTHSSKDVPARYDRRELTEWLQDLVGKRRSSYEERKRPVKIAYISSQAMETGQEPNVHVPLLRDYTSVGIPTNKECANFPSLKQLGDADVVMLVPNGEKKKGSDLTPDSNLGLMLDVLVTVETDPESMNIPVILDNRSGKFDKSLRLITDAFAQGRLLGDSPFHVVESEDEMKDVLGGLKNVIQRRPIIINPESTQPANRNSPPADPVKNVPDDGRFTLFIGGGHANNSKRDLDEAQAMGHHAASQGWRIVTGAGLLEGSMGAVHTGFVQYHLDQVTPQDVNQLSKGVREELASFYDKKEGHYDAEKIIEDSPKLLDKLADKDLIPRDLFYGYSMKSLLKMESPSGKEPPAISYHESGNRVRRLDGLLSPGTKVFMPGSIGTDEEFERTVKQHVEAKLLPDSDDKRSFSDGTDNKDGSMIIYNRDGSLDRLLQHYGLSGEDPIRKQVREKHNIKIVTSFEELKEATSSRAESWQNSWADRVAQGDLSSAREKASAEKG